MRGLLVLALVLVVPVAAASGDPGFAGWPDVPGAAALAEGVTLEQAVQRAEKRYQARAVRAEEKREDGRRVYRIRLLSEDGRVFDITVDAASGRTE